MKFWKKAARALRARLREVEDAESALSTEVLQLGEKLSRPPQHEEQVYIPRGRAYFDIEGPDGKMTGEIPFGNVPDFSIIIKDAKDAPVRKVRKQK